MIVDSHCHLGATRVFDDDVPEELLIATMREHGIDGAVVQPLPAPPDGWEHVHDRIAALAREHPGRIFGMASVPPHIGLEPYRDEVERCVRDLGFVAIKLHTIGHPVVPTSQAGMMVFELAAELGVPVMVHTGLGLPPASPSLVMRAARRFPDLPIILGHAGYGIASAEALVVAGECPNVYLEPSWTPSKFMLGMVRRLGADRVMFGSDLPINVATELAKARSIGLSDDELDGVLAGTATRVFSLPLDGAT